MSEMALTADHIVVIGRGRLIADTSVEELVAASSLNSVRVRASIPYASVISPPMTESRCTS